MTDPTKDRKAARGAENRRSEARARVRDEIAMLALSRIIPTDPKEATKFVGGPLEHAAVFGEGCYTFADSFLTARDSR